MNPWRNAPNPFRFGAFLFYAVFHRIEGEMHPILFKIGSLEIRTYGLFLLLAFFFATLYTAREAQKNGYKKEIIFDLAFWLVVIAIVGSRLLFAFYHWNYYSKHLLEIFAFWEGGLVFYGGVIPDIFFAIWYAKRKGLPIWKMADWIGPAFALGMFIGRWGCFFNGCCYGKPTNSPLGIVFPPGSFACQEFGCVKVHPTQLYESFANLLVFFFLVAIKRRKPFDGFIFWLYVLLGSLIRFIDDFFRSYEPGVLLFGGKITVNQVIAIGLMITSIIFLLTHFRKSAPKTT